MPSKTVKNILFATTNYFPTLVLIVTLVLGIFAADLIRTTETFLSENYLSHQRTRAIIKTNLLVQRGMKTALVAIEQQDEDLFYEAQNQIDAARTFLYTDVYRADGEGRQLERRIAALQQELTQLQRSDMRGELSGNELAELNARAERIFLDLADADTENWTRSVEGSAQRHRDLRGIYYYFGLICFVLIVMTVLLYRTIRQRRSVEGKLQRINASLEQTIESRTRALQVSNELLGDKSKLLQSILDAIPAPIFYKDSEGIYTGCNRAFESFIGHSKDKIVGSTVYDIAPASLAETYHRADLDLMEQGGAQVYEASVQYADGSRHDVIFNKAVISNAAGATTGLVGAMLDITGLRRAEEARKAEEKRVRSIIESSPMGILLYEADDKDRIILRGANPAADAILGIRHDELVGMTMEAALPALTASELPETALDICGEGIQWDTDAFPYRDNNIKGVFELHAFQTTPGQMALFLADVTEKKRQENLLVKAARGVSAQIGEDFFFSLAQHLFEALGADYVLTGEIKDGESQKIDTIAIWSQGGAIENMSYNLKGTPCQNVLSEGVCAHNRDVQTLFPDDTILQDLEVEAYVGIPLRRTDGSALGILAVLFRRPLNNETEAVSLLQIFGARAAAELERRHADQILQESEARFRSMVQTIPEAVILVRVATHRIVDVNDGFTAVTGYSRQEVIDKNSIELGIWENLADRDRMYELLGRDGQVTNMEIRIRLKKGHISSGLLSVRPIQVGNEPHLLIVTRDINEIKQAQEALEKSERQFRELSQQFEALLDGISDALVLFSPERQIVWANRGAEKLFGYRHEELEGMPCTSFWCESTDQCTERLRDCFASGLPIEMMERTKDGRCWGIKLFPIKGRGGRVDNVIQIISDITEKTRLREQATKASRLASLGELAAGVAHEINNPNAQILLNLPIIQESIEDSLPLLDNQFRQQGDFTWAGLDFSRMRQEVPTLISEMQDATKRIKNIVEDLKHFSRRDLTDQMQPVDLNKSVATAARLTRNTIKRATSHFDVEYDDSLPSVNGIEQRLEQVLVNLIINASQALPDTSCRVSIRTCHDEENDRCRIQVSDEGIGISDNILSRITDPFFTTRRETGGTGLGLSIATRIIKEHGGELFFESAPGRGTTVTIELPAEN